VSLATLQIARIVGATPVALTRTSVKTSTLLARGAAHVIATQEQDISKEMKRITGGKSVAVAFDSVAGPGFAQLIEATASERQS
jgi:NADPH:quinone reductase-like Zn-dependent oxidoreductase